MSVLRINTAIRIVYGATRRAFAPSLPNSMINTFGRPSTLKRHFAAANGDAKGAHQVHVNVVDRHFIDDEVASRPLLLDVRELDEIVRLGLIPRSHHLPLSALPAALHLSDEQFRSTFKFEKPVFTDSIVFYCRKGVRSHTAAQLLAEHGYADVSNYVGSFLEWSGGRD